MNPATVSILELVKQVLDSRMKTNAATMQTCVSFVKDVNMKLPNVRFKPMVLDGNENLHLSKESFPELGDALTELVMFVGNHPPKSLLMIDILPIHE